MAAGSNNADESSIGAMFRPVAAPAVMCYTSAMDKHLAVVLISGGLDSCVTAAIAAQDYNLGALHAGYGQRTAAREARAFREICDAYGIRPELRLEIDLDHIGRIGGSALTDDAIDVPQADLDRAGVPVTYVPFRNTHMLAAAVSWAEVIGAGAVFIGAVEDDSSGYPDCRKVYYEAFNRLIEVGTCPETHIEVVTPLIDMSKAKIIRRGIELDAPLHLTWSCYLRSDVACGRCDSCALRLRGFKSAGLTDPIPYAALSDR